MAGGKANDVDPFAQFLLPPPNETPSEKAKREALEAEAKRRSSEIDEKIKQDKIALSKEKKVVKLLLLGPSGSGKSTTLKNFKLQYAPKAWDQERIQWKVVIQLNLVRSVVLLRSIIDAEINGVDPDSSDDEILETDFPVEISNQFTAKHEALIHALSNFQSVQRPLEQKLAPTPTPESCFLPSSKTTDKYGRTKRSNSGEFGVRNWLQLVSPRNEDGDAMDSTNTLLLQYQDRIHALLSDTVVRRFLYSKSASLHIDDTSIYFLKNADRITPPGYIPSDEDVIRARLKTVGIQEHKLSFESGPGIGVNKEWVIYDIGGSHTARASWLPFFASTTALIFVVPTSQFDVRSGPSNEFCLAQTFGLWKKIVESESLSETALIIFLNKIDLLEAKLNTGILFKNSMPSFGDRDNDVGTVTKYLKRKLKDRVNGSSKQPNRPCYTFPTCVTDLKATSDTLTAVKDTILRDHIRGAALM